MPKSIRMLEPCKTRAIDTQRPDNTLLPSDYTTGDPALEVRESFARRKANKCSADAPSFSCRALELQPGSAVLHELKAQVFLAAEQPWPALQSALAATR